MVLIDTFRLLLPVRVMRANPRLERPNTSQTPTTPTPTSTQKGIRSLQFSSSDVESLLSKLLSGSGRKSDSESVESVC